ncbi:MAG: hypothetical protein LBM70_03835 [Victivallales bacterium]|jgi:hypothetical protein|nr:hypothetical protein [Victivallales bacterium]
MRHQIEHGVDDVQRTAFGNHAFASYAGKVFDACAGPATGSQTEATYVASAIDRSTPIEAVYAGSTGDIETRTIGSIRQEVTMFTKILIGIIIMFCIGCLGTEDDNRFDRMRAKDIEKFK